ncbi:hypothetical protein AVEN_274974-1 [Araneus ventricosus]|uniref:Uncharacterized protein n=1 Tax=Araneus ventricosus TaxID=182803 RepID=A0A4Y2X379_ARAVE|nr:hypothetical protein AVEN_274974-1 [Araneus ventricosus]
MSRCPQAQLRDARMSRFQKESNPSSDSIYTAGDRDETLETVIQKPRISYLVLTTLHGMEVPGDDILEHWSEPPISHGSPVTPRHE